MRACLPLHLLVSYDQADACRPSSGQRHLPGQKMLLEVANLADATSAVAAHHLVSQSNGAKPCSRVSGDVLANELVVILRFLEADKL